MNTYCICIKSAVIFVACNQLSQNHIDYHSTQTNGEATITSVSHSIVVHHIRLLILFIYLTLMATVITQFTLQI